MSTIKNIVQLNEYRFTSSKQNIIINYLEGNTAHIKRFDDCPIHYLFPREEMDRYGVLKILEGRCFPRNRVNADDLLHKLGLDNYNLLDIIRNRNLMLSCMS